MVALVRRSSAGHRVSAEARQRDQPRERRSRRRGRAGRRQRAACHAVIDAAESMLLQRNSGDRCQPLPAERQSSRRHIREHRRRAKTKLRPRADGHRRQNSIRPKLRSRLANALPLTCGAAARSRLLDDTTMSLRRGRQVQRLVRRRHAGRRLYFTTLGQQYLRLLRRCLPPTFCWCRSQTLTLLRRRPRWCPRLR